MRLGPTADGDGRVASGVTPYGRYRVEWDADGQLVSAELSKAEPPKAKPVRDSLASGRAPRTGRLMPPGTWLVNAIALITIGLVRPCTGCKSRARAMDRAGWKGLPVLLLRWCWPRLRRVRDDRSPRL